MNYFLDEFGSLLAPMEPVFAKDVRSDGLQYVVRAKGNSGFLFGINYCRNNRRLREKQVRFQVRMKDQVLTFPAHGVDIPDSSLFIWPMNLDMDGARLVYATAQPLFRTQLKDIDCWVFTQDADILPELCLDAAGIVKVEVPPGRGELVLSDGRYVLSGLRPGKDCIITVTRADGRLQKIIVLSREEGRQAWILPDAAGKKGLYISRATLYTKDDKLYLTDTLATMRVEALTGDGIFTSLKRDIPVAVREMPCVAEPKGALQEAEWLVSSVPAIDPSTLLYHKEFQKEFSAGDPARIKSAKLVLAPESECRFRINDKWVDQPIQTGRMNVLDITGYIQKGDNVLLMDFPYATGSHAFAARVLVEYFNTDRLDFSTDSSWLSSDLYYFPATYGSKPVYPITWVKPVVAEQPGSAAEGGAVAARRTLSREQLPGFSAWTMPVPCNYLEGLNNLYLDVRYQGDRISVRWNNKLIADNLNNNTDWLMDLKRGDNELECQDLELEVRPWVHTDRMYFDRAPARSEEGKAGIERVRLVPEYRAIVDIPE